MSKLKTDKTIAKRFSITRRGKVLKRRTRLAHFNARASGEATMQKRKEKSMRPAHAKIVRRLINN